MCLELRLTAVQNRRSGARTAHITTDGVFRDQRVEWARESPRSAPRSLGTLPRPPGTGVGALGLDPLREAARRVVNRRLPDGLGPVGQRIQQAATGTGKSAVSRRFVAATETALSGLLAAPLHGVELVALMFDGVRFGGLDTTHPDPDRHRRAKALRPRRSGSSTAW